MAETFDVIVIGAGPAGVAAATAAGRGGCRVLLIERHGFAGGMATMHAVGEAAGRAAAISRRTGASLADVRGADVRAEIACLDRSLDFQPGV